MIIEKQKQYDNKVKYIAKLGNDKFLLNIYLINKFDEKKNLSESKKNEVSSFIYGDYIKVSGKISIPEMLGNIGEFNYKKYLNSKDICGLINAHEVEYVDNIGNKLISLIYSLKGYIGKQIDKNLPSNEGELLKSMLYGDTRNLDEEVKESFNEIGISHITAVSGSNLNTILLIISIVLYKIKSNRRVYLFIQIGLIFSFCVLSGSELSVIRAGVMSTIIIICKYINIKLTTQKIIIITLYIITIVNPFRMYNIGMVLSFLAIIGLVSFSGRIYNFLESKIKWNIKSKIISKILCSISGILSVTLSVNIFVLPISIYNFNTFSLLTPLANLLVYTLSSCINIFGIIAIFLTKIPFISSFIFFILEILLKLIIDISGFLNSINICIKVKSFHVLILLIYYLYIFIICLNLKNTKKYIKYKLNRIKRRIVVIELIVILFSYIYNTFINNYIYFFNVGQGEMAIIKNKDTYIMIDSGSINNDTSYIFKSYIKKECINNIDTLVISHFHSDHINGILEILKTCKIKYLIYAYPYDLKSDEYVNFVNQLKEENIKHIIVKRGDYININNIKINILFPNIEKLKVSNNIDENENANSLVLNININNKNYLFMGDSLKKSEEYILQELLKKNISKIDVVKIGHHGSKTSTSEKFIQYILPKFAIVSANKKIYNHPSLETINVLNKYSVKTYITEKEGGIKYII